MSDCILINQKTYGVTKVNGKKRLAHRVAYCESKGISIEEIDGLMVLHSCDNPRCVNPSHLRIGSHADNMMDRNSRLRTSKGTMHAMHRIDEQTVNLIRDDYVGKRRGMSLAEVSKKYGISKTQCYRIVNGEAWKHISSLRRPDQQVNSNGWSRARLKIVSTCTDKNILLEDIAAELGVIRRTLNNRMQKGLSEHDASIIAKITGLSMNEIID